MNDGLETGPPRVDTTSASNRDILVAPVMSPHRQPSARPVTPAGPGTAVRGERILVRVDQALAWLDGWLARFLAVELNPLARSGQAANFCILVAVASGILLLFWYSPSVASAYSSLAVLADGTLGNWVRTLHRYSSDLVLLLLVVHAGRMLVARKFAGARWLPWVSGVALLALMWFIGWTGYWLVWDQPAQQVATMSIRLLDGLPIFGEPLERLFVADRLVPSLLFFVVFFLHMLLPLMIAVGLAVHLFRLSRVRLLPPWPLGLALLLGLAVAAWLVPAPLDEPAAMAFKAPQFTVDAWYLAPLALGLRLQGAGLWVALAAAVVAAALIPWILGRRREPSRYQAKVEASRCHACTQCVQDCPYDAITMVARTDGKRFPSQAWVDPARCVGCSVCAGSCDSEAMSMPWFDTRREESRIEREISAARAAGAAPWVALVAGDIEGALAHYRVARWKERLPGYIVQAVPTASWVRPKLIERLLQNGVRGVLILRDARAEAPARDGNRWVELRLAGEREPVFRRDRAAPSGRYCVIDFDPARPAAVAEAALRFRGGDSRRHTVGAPPNLIFRSIVVSVLAVSLFALAIGPSHLRVENPASSAPELVFSFKAFGAQEQVEALDPAAEAAKPMHMRGRVTTKPRRHDVTVRRWLDGVEVARTYRAKGLSQDGPSMDQWREALTPGRHHLVVELLTGPDGEPLRWEGEIEARPRHLTVLTYDPTAGFVLD